MRTSQKPERATRVRGREDATQATARRQATTCREPTLDDILADPIVVALMRADGVDAYELAAMLSRVGGHRSVTRSREPFAPVE